ncbi:DNA cytosine methyltransferase [Lactococcus raffinolactis]|uniref:DNA cytosine methyltransferase n=1 Tax=Pseudolactococcus raffinolactis TaxID=1366 RepID=UPI001436C9A3|nr:DNA (cytosine-5-)-methyltransferase [Lactococcus raffinolactis]QIW51207.1 DNA (cytosine-5-)-methyltransferase [Lactococcus raffinolactis]
MTLQILELFGGIGSPRIALRNLGIDVKSIDYVEIDKKAVDSYNAMFASDMLHKTQSVVDWNLKPDILIHGSPCQDISIAGRKLGADEGSGTRSSLMWETLRIIEEFGEWKPKIVIWENVKGVLHKQMKQNFEKYLYEMCRLGYTNSVEILNATEFGLPQYRDRVFTISRLDGQRFNFDELERFEMRPISEFLVSGPSEWHLVNQPSMTKHILGHKDFDKNRKWKRNLHIIKDWCYTISTRQDRNPNSGIVEIAPNEYRYLTARECWLLQGYDEADYEAAAMVSSKTQLYRQAGNSIPVPIFESIFKALLESEIKHDNS